MERSGLSGAGVLACVVVREVDLDPLVGSRGVAEHKIQIPHRGIFPAERAVPCTGPDN